MKVTMDLILEVIENDKLRQNYTNFEGYLEDWLDFHLPYYEEYCIES